MKAQTKTKKATATKTVAKAKGNKSAKSVKDNGKVTKTDKPVITAKRDLTATPHACSECGVKETKDADGVSNFSYLKATGKPRQICKPCQTAKSKEWTSRPDVAEMRKVQALARQMQNAGIPALVPDAKTYVKGQPLMTAEYATDKDGKVVPIGTKGATVHKSVEAMPLWEAYRAEVKAEREAKRAERDELANAAKEQRKAEREAKRAERDANREAEKARKAEERKAKKAERAAQAVQKAEQLKAEREQKAAEKAAEKARKVAEAAEAKKQEAAQKAAEKAQTTAEKAVNSEKSDTGDGVAALAKAA